ncbi:MAG: DUF3619 family protein [Pseudomonadota bacterium]|nr:DUF3619 family protein [Pseudomonadota bacterium]
MTETTFRTASSHGFPPAATLDTLEARFALRVAACLTERNADLGPDLTERLRHAREQALERARTARKAEASVPVGVNRSGTAILGLAGSGWGRRFAMVIPALALAGGLVMIQRWQDSSQISAAAEVDAALLSDDLPPNAYSDAGFAEYLKSPVE